MTHTCKSLWAEACACIHPPVGREQTRSYQPIPEPKLKEKQKGNAQSRDAAKK